jgi:hypothetical protein
MLIIKRLLKNLNLFRIKKPGYDEFMDIYRKSKKENI